MNKFTTQRCATRRYFTRRDHQRRRHGPKPKKSTWVKFMDSLENRGPLSPGSPYERWTKKVRADMEEARTWPKGTMACSVQMVAEYWSRILREFWSDNPRVKWYEWRGHEVQGLVHAHTLHLIHRKLRHKGRRGGEFEICPWNASVYTGYCYVNNRKHGRGEILIRHITPFTDFNDHGAGI